MGQRGDLSFSRHRFVAMTDASPEPAPEIEPKELASALEAGAVVIDVRELDEYVESHIAGTRLIPRSELQQRWQEIPTDQGRVYHVCAVGGRSGRAAVALRQAGVDAVNVAGGLKAWRRDGRPVESGQP
jgi:rhodanese-related sulfurtransferase